MASGEASERQRVALVTGAASGIGEAIARRFARESYRVLALDRDSSKLERLAGTAGAEQVVTVCYDLLDVDGIDPLVRGLSREHGGLDVLVNCAAVWFHQPFLDLGMREWEETFRVNVSAVFRLSQQVALRWMRAGGRIVHIASTNALAGEAGWSSYDASKGAIISLTRTMAIELAPRGILVNAVCPGLIDTPANADLLRDPKALADWTAKIPLGRVGRPEEVAAAVSFLSSQDAGFITGQILVVDGGQLACGDQTTKPGGEPCI